MKKSHISKVKIKYISFSVAAIFAVLLISGTSFYFNKEEPSQSASVKSRSVLLDEAATSALTDDILTASNTSLFIENEELESDLTALITDYLNAKLTLNSETLESLILSDAAIDYKKLGRKVEYIESYENIKTYIADGIKGIDYVIYVTYDVRFPMTSAPAPSLEEFYVKKTDGAYKLYMNPLSETASSYVLELREEPQVQKLINDTTKQLMAALDSDSNLLDIYNSFLSTSN